MTEESLDTNGELKGKRKKKGVLKQVLGAAVAGVAVLNLLFSFKGGTEPDPFYYVMLLSGIVIAALGIVQSKSV